MKRPLLLELISTLLTLGVAPGVLSETVSEPPIVYTRDIAPIFQRSCQRCHRPGRIGPMPLMSYEDAQPWAQAIRVMVESRKMPPWFADPRYGEFLDDPSLSDEEISKIAAWAAAGAPRGNPLDLPPPRTFSERWTIGRPDLVLTMPKTARVRAEGRDRFMRVRLKPGLAQDRWIQAVEIRPGNTKVVHHAIAYVLQKGHSDKTWRRKLRRSGYLLTEYSAGNQGDRYPEDTGRLLEAGAQILLEIHYHPYGEEANDRTQIAFRFHREPGKVQNRVISRALANHDLRIPAGAPNYQHVSEDSFERPYRLLSFQPHMHYRGKSMRLEALYPNGSTEVLASVPSYDFYWQITYSYRNPPLLPAGTTLRVTSVFDNSAGNRLNPDPTRAVRWGPKAIDEMAIGWVDLVEQVPTGQAAAQVPATQAQGPLSMHDAHNNATHPDSSAAPPWLLRAAKQKKD